MEDATDTQSNHLLEESASKHHKPRGEQKDKQTSLRRRESWRIIDIK